MTILHSGTTRKYSENWDAVFSGKSKTKSLKKAQPKKKSPKQAAARAVKKKTRPARKK